MREEDPEKALELRTAPVRGRWSTVDWFDSDGRRFVLGLSKGRVSTLVSSAMRQLGVQTRAQLVKKLRDFKIVTDG